MDLSVASLPILGKRLVPADLLFGGLCLVVILRAGRDLWAVDRTLVATAAAVVVATLLTGLAAQGASLHRIEIARTGYSMAVLLVLAHLRLGADGTRRVAVLWLSLAAVLAGLGVVSLAGVVWFRLPPNIFAEVNSPNLGAHVVRISGPLSTNALILYLTLSLCFCALLDGLPSRRLRRLAHWTLPILVVAAGLTLSRGLLGFFAASTLLALSPMRSRVPAWVRYGLAGITALLLVLALTATVWAIFPIKRDASSSTGLSLSTRPNAYALLHAAALRMWRSAPLLGVGPGEFGSRLRDVTHPDERRGTWPPLGDSRRWDPHSTWFGLLAETGAVGVAAWLALLGVIRARLRGAAAAGAQVASLAGPVLIGVAIAGFFVSLEHLKFVWAFVGLVLADARGQAELVSGSPSTRN